MQEERRRPSFAAFRSARSPVRRRDTGDCLRRFGWQLARASLFTSRGTGPGSGYESGYDVASQQREAFAASPFCKKAL